MPNSDACFPVEYHRDEDGLQYGFILKDLGEAVHVWYHAQQGGNVRVGDAALAFNVSPALICTAVEKLDNPFFWIVREPIPHAQRRFDTDGL